jgi:hypothetical protein
MSLHRAGLMAITTLFTAGLSSAAFAGCCDWGVSAAPISYASAYGCGGCGAAYAAPIAYAAPVTYAAPIGYARAGCGGCGATLIAPSPIYVVNQGPHYAGPAIMTYRRYSTGYVGAYPYVYRAGTPYTGYDGGPYANPVDYRPAATAYAAPAVEMAPPARIIRRYVGPRRYITRHPYIGPRGYIAPRAHIGPRGYIAPRAHIAPRAAAVRVYHRHGVAPRARYYYR